MNCRFCGTIVPNPPSDCPKCGRPVSQSDYTRATEQAVAADIVYRQGEKSLSKRSPLLFVLGIVGVAVLVTLGLVGYRSRSTEPAERTAPVPQTTPTPEQSGAGARPIAAAAQQPAPAEHPKMAAPEETPAETPVYSGPSVDELVLKAKAALARGDRIEPAQDNALKWAREARLYGSKEGESIENQIYGQLLKSAEDARIANDYATALKQVDQMISLFPNRTSLPTLRAAIQKEQREKRP